MKKLAGKRLAVIAGGLSVVLAASVAFAAWTATGSGSGYSKATTAQALTTLDVSADTVAQLYPGGSGDLVIKIHNPNPYAVTVSNVNNAAVGSIATTDATAACDASTGVTFTNTSGLSIVVAAGGNTETTLVGKVHMSNSSDNSCQGKTFNIPVDLVGASS